VLYVGKYKYFVPMESPKPNHAKLKAGKHLMKLDGGKLGLLGFNNMLPVADNALIAFNIDEEPDKKYAELLRRQVSFCNRNKATIYSKASSTYYDVVTKQSSFLCSISCDFKALEKACDKYDPNYQK
jgi:protein AbiQ